MHDVVIAGAGPAGSIAALVLARAGVKVALLDRARFPRPKLCGDSINPGALAVLRHLGISHVTAGGLLLDGMLVSGEGGVRVTGLYGGGRTGIALSREVLDLRLLEAAAQAGAVVEDNIVVQGAALSDDGRMTIGVLTAAPGGVAVQRPARVTIAADGRQSRLARGLRLSHTPRKPRRWAVGSVFSGVTGLSSLGEMHVRRGRYLGIAPLPDGTANACVVTSNTELLKDQDLVLRTMRQDAELGGRFARAVMLKAPTVLGPLAVDAVASGMPGLLLAGDAAGFIDPMTGDGLRFAFRGGELAAQFALDALEGGLETAHLRLDRARRHEFGAKWRFNRVLRALASSPAAVRAAGLGASLAPPMLAHVISYAGDVQFA
ncbi:MAG TPA: NAD(P)/FAD-dependent oxidoreductase [Vicinamibacterales bacterium]|nr:NAD(P)/FAD-dependent oxidoreductase [Vicinamibacterales bacterium]